MCTNEKVCVICALNCGDIVVIVTRRWVSKGVLTKTVGMRPKGFRCGLVGSSYTRWWCVIYGIDARICGVNNWRPWSRNRKYDHNKDVIYLLWSELLRMSETTFFLLGATDHHVNNNLIKNMAYLKKNIELRLFRNTSWDVVCLNTRRTQNIYLLFYLQTTYVLSHVIRAHKHKLQHPYTMRPHMLCSICATIHPIQCSHISNNLTITPHKSTQIQEEKLSEKNNSS